jgi:hypothetical protein
MISYRLRVKQTDFGAVVKFWQPFEWKYTH